MMQKTDSNLSQATTKEAVTEQQVLIAGGGHVGLSFALLLAHHGIASTLLEKTVIQTLVLPMIEPAVIT